MLTNKTNNIAHGKVVMIINIMSSNILKIIFQHQIGKISNCEY